MRICGDPIAPAERITSFLALTTVILFLLFLKITPFAVLFSRINLQTRAFVIIVKFSLSRTGSRYPRDVLQRSPLNTVRSKIPKPSWQNPLMSFVSLYPASFPALIKA